MTLKTQMIADLDVFFNRDEFAQAVTYTPYGGSPSSITAVVHYGPDEAEKAHYIMDVIKVRVKATDVATPVYMDKVTLANGEVWYVQMWEYNPNGSWKCTCSREERPKMQ